MEEEKTMRLNFPPILSLNAILLFSILPCEAQSVALLDAPLPAANISAEPGSSSGSSIGGFAIARAPQPAPKRPRLHLLDWSMIGAAATLRVLDYTSTEKALAHPQYYHEAILPQALVQDKPGFAAFEAGTVALNYGAYRLLVRHNLRSLARASQYLYVGIMANQVARNDQLLGQMPGN
jgi:hypothetical protein